MKEQMINLELYRIFYTVANCGSITKASIKLNISQPAITRHIKNLEAELKVSLFTRTKKGVTLNENGEKIFDYISQALLLIDEAEKKIKNLDSGILKIGISNALIGKYFLNFIMEFRKLYPNIVVEISTEDTEKLISLVKSGLLDLIIVKFPDYKEKNLDYIPIGKIGNVFISHKNNNLLINKKIKLSEIADYPIIVQKNPSQTRKYFENYCHENNIHLNIAMSMSNVHLLLDFVENNYGIGFINNIFIDEELKKRQLFELNVTPEPEKHSFGIIRLKNNSMSFSSQTFIEIILKSLK